MAKLDSLIVDLQVNSAALREGLDAAKAQMKSFGDAVGEIGESIHALSEMAAFEFGKKIVEGVGEFVLKGAEAADAMGKLAQAAGVPVETMSRLGYAMSLSGLSSEEAGAAFNKLNKSITAAASGAVEQSAVFKALGVSVTGVGGAVRPTENILGDLADKFAGMKDGAGKSALAIDIFGKSGAALVPFLNRGSAGIKDLEAEADRLGITLNVETVAAVTEFNDNMIRMKAATKAVAVGVASELAPALTKLTDELLKSESGAGALKEAASVLSTVLKIVASAAVIVGGTLETMGIAIAGALGAVVAWKNLDISGGIEGVKGAAKDATEAMSHMGERLKTVWSDPEVKKAPGYWSAAIKDAMQMSGDVVAANVARMKKSAEEAASAFTSLTKQLEEMQAKSSSIGGGPMADMINRITSGDIAKQLAKLGPVLAGIFSNSMLAAIDETLNKERSLRESASSFTQNRANTQTDRSAALSSASFGDIGQTVSAVFARLTAGFSSFQDALAAYTSATKAEAADAKAAADAAGNKDTVAENAALLKADADKAGALAAKTAMDAYSNNAKVVADATRTYGESMHQISVGTAFAMLDMQKQLTASANGGLSMTGETAAQREAIKGYQDEAAALKRFVDDTEAAAIETSLAAKFAAQGFSDLAQEAKDNASALSRMAEADKEAASAFVAASARINSIILSAVSTLASKMGQAGNVIQSAMQGFAQGGFIGAIIAAIVSIIDQFKGFATIVNGINSFLSKIIGALEPGVSALLNFIQMTADMSNAIIPLIPLFKLISDALTLAVLTMEGTIMAIESVWAWLEGFFDKNGQKQTQTNIDAMKKTMTDQWNSMQNPFAADPTTSIATTGTGTPPMQVMANATAPIRHLGSAAGDAASALNKMVASLTNVPQGFKVALARFNATAGPKDIGPKDGGLAGNHSATKGGDVHVHVPVTGGIMVTVDQIVKAVTNGLQQSSFHQHGVKLQGPKP